MTFDITQVLLALIALVSASITSFLIPWIRSKTSAAQQEQLMAWVKIAVAAAEQLFAASGSGKQKKEYVLRWLEERNLRFDEAAIDAAIEAAVWALKR